MNCHNFVAVKANFPSLYFVLFLAASAAFKSPINLHKISLLPRKYLNVRHSFLTGLSSAATAYDGFFIRVTEKQLIHPPDTVAWKFTPDIWESLSQCIGERIMLTDCIHGDKVDLKFKHVESFITMGAAALQSLGLQPGQCVSIFAENSHKWLITDQAIMKVRIQI
jgi:hypothetical protein